MNDETTKILVIEDINYLRNDVIEMLRFEGFDVRGAENGRIGVDIANEFQPHLIICDIMMPELDGYGVLKAIREKEDSAVTPFIFLTAKTERADVRYGMGQGAEDYVTKPFLMHELLDTIKARLTRHGIYIKTAEQKANKKLDELRVNITTSLPHELRTPLNTIIGFSDMLAFEAHSLKPEQVLDWSQHINSAALRLHRLVENYLTYVRIETIARDAKRLQALHTKKVENVSAIIQFQAMTRAQQVQRESDLQIDVTLGDPLAISEVDLNKIIDELVDNAFKFSQEGAQVDVTGFPIEGCYVIRIADQGRGMKQEEIDQVGAFMQFERWFYEQQGLGLGLTIAKRLAELHGGTLAIDSVIGKGTVVTVSLPYAQ